MTKCTKCKTKIYSHLWIVYTWDNQARVYCSPLCERNTKSQFEHLYRFFNDARKAKAHPNMAKK